MGHSYGTRVVGSAVFDRMVIEPRSDVLDTGSVPIALIGLQAAFPVQRFSPKGKEPVFANWQSAKLLSVWTSSKHDSATSALDRWWGPNVGGGAGIKRAKKVLGEGNGISTGAADDQGVPKESLATSGMHFTNAEAVIRRNVPNTGGGAHSDVFDAEAGRLIWSVTSALKKVLARTMLTYGRTAT